MDGKKLLSFFQTCLHSFMKVWQNAFLCLFFSCLSLSYAQEIGPVWYFGNNAGLDFNSGVPVVLTNGALVSDEGCATLTDANGQIMFYTNGNTVWNKDHVVMDNGTGLFGNVSSAQGVVIVQRPGSNTIFYVFTVDTQPVDAGYKGLRYSEVDMTLDSGLGAVTSNKNIFIATAIGEMLTIVRHSNGTDRWVAAVGYPDNKIYATLITAAGVNTTPVVSDGGPALSNYGWMGAMKVSPDGTKLAHSHLFSGVQLSDFDPATGLADNYITLTTDSMYGVEFSPSGKLLYTSSYTSSTINQYNLEAADIAASAINISPGNQIHDGGGLQLATDGKIYFCRYNLLDALDVINSPDVLGITCNYQINALYLGGKTINSGLPAATQVQKMTAVIMADKFCLSDATEFSLSSVVDANSVTWNFGDGNFSNEVNPTHVYASIGTYTVSASFTIGGVPQTLFKTIEILEMPTATQPPDMTACGDENGQAVFDLSTQRTTILGPLQLVDFSVGFYTSLEDAKAGVNFITEQYTNTSNPQTIYARVSPDAGICHAITSFILNVVRKPVLIMPDAFAFCQNSSVTITAPAGFSAYVWSTGATSQSIVVSKAGSYTITVYQVSGGITCEAVKTITVTEAAKPEITYIEINDWTDNKNSIVVTVSGSGNYEYSINGINYQTSPVFNGLLPGKYTVYVNDINNCGTDKQEVVVLMYPRFFTPNGDGKNEVWTIKAAFFEPNMKIHIFDRYGKLIYSFNGSEPGWNGEYNGHRLPSTDYWFLVERSDGREHKGHFSMIR
ncbi:T9SS type B sorting domain-containing protein [Flavobacterium cerinum]|uniref:T9SS type B sorting domain-containing protein n=1 Tax=Flavobacterium cerinum TaxID=2502784 RepID=A0A444H8N7_9FLAO|nr:T9SS type B sorting domain-containing protein [Flavobacterium cerinum]RWW99644.1 T9SS type B sorting domain-containing protein [Flavobacterium cerinum]